MAVIDADARAPVEYESRVRFRYAVIAFVAALLVVASQLVQLSGARSSVSELTTSLIIDSKRETLDIIGAILQLIALVSVGVVLSWLFRASRARNPTQKPVIRWLAITGAILSGVMAAIEAIFVIHKAHEFVSSGSQGYPQAEHLMSGALLLVLELLPGLGALMLAVGCVLISLNALRVGLTTRLVGYFGVVAGAMFIISIQEIAPLVEAIWLAFLAVTLAARWPSGDPPAWESGVAVPWQPMQQGQRSAPASRSRAKAKALDSSDGSAAPKPRAGTPKRKRRRSS